MGQSRYKHMLFPLPIAFAVLYNIPKFFETVKCSEEEIYRTMIGDLSSNPIRDNDTNNDTHNDTHVQIYFNRVNETIWLSKEGLLEGDASLCDPYDTRTTSLRRNEWYIVFYVCLSELIFVEIVPWISVIVLNINTWRGMKRFQEKRQMLKNRCNVSRGIENQL